MKPETLHLLCDPMTRNPLWLQQLHAGEKALQDIHTGRRHPVVDGIPDFLQAMPVTGMNKRYQQMYDILSPFYNFVTRTAISIMRSSEETVRREYLCELEIDDGASVLEVSVGTGTNLRLLPGNARYYGLDISAGQLKQCKKILKKIGMGADLFLGQAEHLPFRDNSFDVVFHMGGINFFSDPALAMNEMLRVAKPGSKIVVVDETDKFTKQLARIPIVREFFKNHNGMATPNLAAPAHCEDLQNRELFNGRLWYLSFRKPQAEFKPTASFTGLLQRTGLQGRA